MSSDEAPAVSGKYQLNSGCFNYFRKQQKQSRCHLFDANFGQLVKKSRIYNFAKGWKIIKLTIFTFLLQVICNWNNSSRVRELARRMERSQSRARWHSQTRFSGEILKLKSTKTTKNYKKNFKFLKIFRVAFCTTTWRWIESNFLENVLRCIFCQESAFQVQNISQIKLSSALIVAEISWAIKYILKHFFSDHESHNPRQREKAGSQRRGCCTLQ